MQKRKQHHNITCTEGFVTLPKAAFMESLEGSPAYTPEQKGSMRRSNTSSPRFLLTYCSTDSSRSGRGFLRPAAPKPAPRCFAQWLLVAMMWLHACMHAAMKEIEGSPLTF